MDFDTSVKLQIYQTIVETSISPNAADVAAALARPVDDVEAAFLRLGQKRLLVLEPGTTSKIRMAPPFSGVETPFVVRVDGQSYFANCAWDALGIPAALQRDADIAGICPDCNAPLSLQVRGGAPVPQDCVAHFAVPAAKWWDDIVYT